MTGNEEQKEMIARLAEIATLAGIKGQVEEDGTRFTAGYGSDDGRSQMVYACAIRTPCGPGVSVYSPAARYKKGFFGGLSKEAAIELLKLNERTFFARFGLRDVGDETLLVASVDLLIETLDPEELRAAMGSVSGAADRWEEKVGKGDDF